LQRYWCDLHSGCHLNLMPDRHLDTSGMTCPIPVLKTKKALADMEAGTTLEVIATDPAAANDFIAFCKATGNRLIESGRRDGAYWFLIERGT
jgi:tRNA 2-thiouridine synthesizing protein A